MAAIAILVNGETREVERQTDLADLLRTFLSQREARGVETERSCVRRSDWPQTIVSDGDKIEVVHFVGGG
jgi:thiamine biosynthesis protein ThiS